MATSRVVEHLAELTGFRDRDLLDVTLIGALRDLVQPRAVAIYRAVGEEGEQRWLTRARLAPGDLVPTADPVWADIDSLPLLGEYAARYACLQRQEAISLPGSQAMAYFPLINDSESVGVLELQTDAELSHDDERLVTSILRVFRNFQALLDYSERDTLTGLLNRKTFDESFLRIATHAPPPALALPATVIGRQAPSGSSWLGVIDIDHFKHVNDNHGHLIGDEVLLLLSRLMRGCFRFHDHLYRFGGEEFVVLMRCNHAADAATALERLRSTVRDFDFPQVGQISISIGFTELRTGDSPSSAFERADKAVYYAKQHGRDQVRDHAALVAQGQLTEESRASDVELF